MFPNSYRVDLGQSELDYLHSPWGLSPFSQIPKSVRLTSAVTETKENRQNLNMHSQITPCASVYLSINAQPFNSERKTLWTKNESQDNCWLCSGWIYIGRKLRPYTGWESNGSYRPCLSHAKLASPVWSYSLNPMCNFSFLEKAKSLGKGKPASQGNGDELHLCRIRSVWDQVVCVQPTWEQNAKKEAGDKLSQSASTSASWVPS